MFVSKTGRKGFEPCSITLETMDEVEMMYAIFNFTPIVEALPGLPVGDIREQLKGIYSHIDYQRYFQSLGKNYK